MWDYKITTQQNFNNAVKTCRYIMDITIGFGQAFVERKQKKQLQTRGNVRIYVELDKPTSQNKG